MLRPVLAKGVLMTSSLAVREGRFLVYRLYDVANEIDLVRAEQLIATGTRVSRLQLRRLGPKVVRFAAAPLTLHVPLDATYILPDLPPVHGALIRLYDFGAVCVRLDMDIPPRTPLESVHRFHRLLLDADVGDLCRPLVRRTLESLVPALYKPQWEDHLWLEEDYLILYVRAFDAETSLPADALPDRIDLARLLMGEEFPLSAQVRNDVLRYMYTYSTDDLAVISWDTAFVYDTEGIMDVPDLLEFANAQLLELAFFDAILDEELEAAYDDVEALQRQGGGLLRYRRLRRILNRLLTTIMEITELSGRVMNALRLTEDVFYARVYTGATEVLGLQAWMAGVQEKVHNLRDIYTLLAEEAENSRMALLELGIVLLIVVEILLFMIK